MRIWITIGPKTRVRTNSIAKNIRSLLLSFIIIPLNSDVESAWFSAKMSAIVDDIPCGGSGQADDKEA